MLLESCYSLPEYGPEQGRAKAIRCFQANKCPGAHSACLHKMGDRGKHNLAALLWDQVELTVPRLLPLYTLMFVLALISPAALLLGKQGLQVIVLVFAANMALHFGEQKRNRGHFESVKAVSSLIRCGEELCRGEQDWNTISPLLLELRSASKVRGFRSRSFYRVESRPFLGTSSYVSIFLRRCGASPGGAVYHSSGLNFSGCLRFNGEPRCFAGCSLLQEACPLL